MSERLTKRLANGGVMYDNGEYWRVCYPWNEHCLNSIDRMAIKLCEIEDKIEQVDVVEVVRCKDCKHCTLTEEGEHAHDDIVCDYFMTDGLLDNDFCSYGERRENGN